MKKFFIAVLMFTVFLLVGCDKKNEEIDMSGNAQVKQNLSKYSESEAYGEVLHHGELAKRIGIKNVKMGDNIYTFAIGLAGDTRKEGVALVCDIRSNEAILTHNIKNDEGYIPRGNLEISIMQYRPGVKDIREADEDQDPVFSTANGDDDFLKGLTKAGKLPKDTVLAIVIDKADNDGNYHGIAWSPLFTVEQLLNALPDSASKCAGLRLDLNGDHLVVAERPQS